MYQRFGRGAGRSESICNYCHKRGHWKRDCYALDSRTKQVGDSVSPKPATLIAPVSEVSSAMQSYLPFISDGAVSLVRSEEKIHVKILRDTGAFYSFNLASALPFSNDTSACGRVCPWTVVQRSWVTI